MLEKIAEQHANLHYIDPDVVLCNEDMCQLETFDNHPIFSDMTHFSIYGAELVAPYIFSIIDLEGK